MSYLAAITVYLTVVGLIGISAYVKTRSERDFSLGGRSLTPLTTALSANASDMSGWLLLGLPGAIYLSGLGASWIVIGLVIGAFCNWQFVSQRLRLASRSFSADAKSLPQFFVLRTNTRSNAIPITASIVTIVFYVIYIATGFIVAGKLFESVLGWEQNVAIVIGAVVVLIYVCVGGFLAASWTDTFQALLMMVALIVVPLLALSHIPALAEPRTTVEFAQLSVIDVVSALAWGLGYFGQPHILARFFAIRNAKKLVQAKVVGMTWMIVCTVAAVCIGLVGQSVLPEIADPERIFIELSKLVLHPFIAGLIITAVLAAVMSTVDSQLVVASAAIVDDLGLFQQGSMWLNRAFVFIIIVVSGWAAILMDKVVLQGVAYAWAGFGSSFGPALLFSLYWKHTTSRAILASMITGLVTTVCWHHLPNELWSFSIGELDISLGSYGIYEMIPAFLLACIVLMIVSWKWPDENAARRALSRSIIGSH